MDKTMLSKILADYETLRHEHGYETSAKLILIDYEDELNGGTL